MHQKKEFTCKEKNSPFKLICKRCIISLVCMHTHQGLVQLSRYWFCELRGKLPSGWSIFIDTTTLNSRGKCWCLLDHYWTNSYLSFSLSIIFSCFLWFSLIQITSVKFSWHSSTSHIHVDLLWHHQYRPS